MMQHQLKRKLKELGFEKPVLWTSLPTAVDVCKSMDNSGIVYYCGDDFGALAGVDHQTVLEHEEDLIDCCDLILAASEKLAAKFPQDKTVTLLTAWISPYSQLPQSKLTTCQIMAEKYSAFTAVYPNG